MPKAPAPLLSGRHHRCNNSRDNRMAEGTTQRVKCQQTAAMQLRQSNIVLGDPVPSLSGGDIWPVGCSGSPPPQLCLCRVPRQHPHLHPALPRFPGGAAERNSCLSRPHSCATQTPCASKRVFSQTSAPDPAPDLPAFPRPVVAPAPSLRTGVNCQDEGSSGNGNGKGYP